MPEYTFTGAIPRVFTSLQVGVGGVTVKPADPEAPAPEAGTTVLLAFGDVLTVPEEIEGGHPDLVLGAKAAGTKARSAAATVNVVDASDAPSGTTFTA